MINNLCGYVNIAGHDIITCDLSVFVFWKNEITAFLAGHKSSNYRTKGQQGNVSIIMEDTKTIITFHIKTSCNFANIKRAGESEFLVVCQ